MKIVFDAGPIISLTTNNLLWLIPEFKKTGCEFFIPDVVKKELVDKPLATKKYKFEALQVQALIDNNKLQVYRNYELEKSALEMLDAANKCFFAHGQNIQIVHLGEMQAVASAAALKADAVVMDEKTTRLLIENADLLLHVLSSKLHIDIDVNENNIKKFKALTKDIKIIRSSEMVTVAFEKGLLSKYLSENIKNNKKELLDALLWGLKDHGCAISSDEINKLEKTILRQV